MIFSKIGGLNDDVFGKSIAPIKKFLIDNEKVAMREHKVLEDIFTMQKSDSWATKFSGLTSKGDFKSVGMPLICSL